MKKLLLAATAAAAFAVAPANAANFIVSGGTNQAVPINNDFKAQLASLGLTAELIGAKVDLSSGATIKFEFLGSESWFSDSFVFNGSTIYSENANGVIDQFAAPINLGNYWNPTIAFLAAFTSNGIGGGGALPADALGGSTGFSVFVADGNVTSLNSSVIYFGYDDIPDSAPGNPMSDDNHDDIIIRATILAVPEPTTWALMVAGIAAVGFSMRRRSQNVRVAFS
jgi:hypothetical protein